QPARLVQRRPVALADGFFRPVVVLAADRERIHLHQQRTGAVLAVAIGPDRAAGDLAVDAGLLERLALGACGGGFVLAADALGKDPAAGAARGDEQEYRLSILDREGNDSGLARGGAVRVDIAF